MGTTSVEISMLSYCLSINDLPDVLLIEIFRVSTVKDRARLAVTCKKLNFIYNNTALFWRSLDVSVTLSSSKHDINDVNRKMPFYNTFIENHIFHLRRLKITLVLEINGVNRFLAAQVLHVLRGLRPCARTLCEFILSITIIDDQFERLKEPCKAVLECERLLDDCLTLGNLKVLKFGDWPKNYQTESQEIVRLMLRGKSETKERPINMSVTDLGLFCISADRMLFNWMATTPLTTTEAFLQIFPKFPNLQSLSLNTSGVNDKVIKELCRRKGKLKRLVLIVTRHEPCDYQHLSKILIQEKFRSLGAELELVFNGLITFCSDCLSIWIDCGLPVVSVTIMKDCWVTDTLVQLLATKHSHSLHKFHLFGKVFSGSFFEFFIQFIRSCPNLTSFVFEGQDRVL